MSDPKLVFNSCLVRLPSNVKRMVMKCPHCLIAIHYDPERKPLGADSRGVWVASCQVCPACEKQIIYLKLISHPPFAAETVIEPFLVYPRNIAREPLSPEVPEEFASDYREACAILSDSPKASAALSRRCLQHLIHKKAGIKKRGLSQEIDELISSKTIPSYLVEDLDAIRNIGNFAAHPIKSTNTGAIVEVEPGEAEWSLILLEGLFDFYFVQPALSQKKKDALNKKLSDSGKPLMN